MGAVPVEANTSAFFEAVDREMFEVTKRLGTALQELGSSWTGDASESFQHVLQDWRLAYTGLFGDFTTQQPGVIGVIARHMGVSWYDHTSAGAVLTEDVAAERVEYAGQTGYLLGRVRPGVLPDGMMLDRVRPGELMERIHRAD